ncbi:hypothetical protein UlMin_017712 [Ulmus minor]
MNGTESFELFCWYAFRRSSPNDEYSEVSRMVVDYCGGLPLALEVLGSFLYRRSTAEWQSTLEKLKRSPHRDIKKVLQISFDGLEDDEVQSIFLDVSCFFIGMNKDFVELILDGCELDAKTGINILLERSLLTIRENDKLMMHDLLRDMGRDLVQEKFPKEPGKWSRLWSPKVVSDVLSKQSGTKYVEGLTLNVDEAKKVSFSTKAFEKMQRLRLLQLNHVQLNGSYEYLSEELRWLCWHGFALEFIPNNFYLGNLVALDLQYSNLAHVWEEPKISESNIDNLPNLDGLSHLKRFILGICDRLQSIPDLPTNLKWISVIGCRQLKRVPDMSRMPHLFSVVLDDNLLDVSGLNNLLTNSLRYLYLIHDFSMPTTLNERIIWVISFEIPSRTFYNYIFLFFVNNFLCSFWYRKLLTKGVTVC